MNHIIMISYSEANINEFKKGTYGERRPFKLCFSSSKVELGTHLGRPTSTNR